MEVRFVHVGMGRLVQAGRVLAVIRASGAVGKSHRLRAREEGRYIDATGNKGLKTLLLMDDGSVMGSMITAKTLLKRLNGLDLPSVSKSPGCEVEDDYEEDDVEEEEEE